MSPFPDPLKSRAIPLLADNVDTDIIIPSREMRSTGRSGLADGLFAPWRYREADARIEDPEFVLNRPEFRQESILLAGANFGCGSSREHAVWALAEYGIASVVAESFGTIFQANCVRNGILPITLTRPTIAKLAGETLSISLADQVIEYREGCHRFEIDAEAKTMLAGGVDAIDLTMAHGEDIARWTEADRSARPWIYLEHRP